MVFLNHNVHGRKENAAVLMQATGSGLGVITGQAYVRTSGTTWHWTMGKVRS